MNAVKDKWMSFSAREKGLLAFLGALLAALFLWYGLIMPLRDAKADAERSFAAAQREALEIQSAARQAELLKEQQGENHQSAPTGGPVNLRQIVGQTTQAAGLTLSRIQPDTTSGGLTIWLDSVEATALLRWVKALHETHGISAHRVAIQRGEGTAVRAQLLLRAKD